MNAVRPFSCICALVLLAGSAVVGLANGPRQYYGSWQRNTQANYYYRPYYYKPTPTYAGYKHHYAIYYPTRPTYTYFYSPYSKSYWGRCPSTYPAGQPQYSILAAADRRASIDDIPEKAFPPLGNMPAVPDSKDGAVMEPPPDDLPSSVVLPK